MKAEKSKHKGKKPACSELCFGKGWAGEMRLLLKLLRRLILQTVGNHDCRTLNYVSETQLAACWMAPRDSAGS